jgi:hypothetical protein
MKRTIEDFKKMPVDELYGNPELLKELEALMEDDIDKAARTVAEDFKQKCGDK